MAQDDAENKPTGGLTDHISLGVLTGLIHRDVVDDVIAECGKREKRARLLPAHVVVYYVLALNLFFDQAYEEVMRLLAGGLRFLGNWNDAWKVPSTSALSQSRARLGEEPLRLLFDRVAAPMTRPGARGAWLAGRRVMALDGLVLDAPDTAENAAAFGRPGNAASPGPFPQVRLVGLGEAGTHAITDAALGPISTGEQTLAAEILARLEADMLVTADRNLCATRRSIAFPAQPGGIGGKFLDLMAYLTSKEARGPEHASKPAVVPGGWIDAPGGPHVMAKARLPESQSPVVSRSRPPESHLKPAPSLCA